jgi:hypothetical protein
MNIVNWGLLKHPFNWLTVVLMVLIVGIAVTFAMQHFTPVGTTNQ